MTTTKPPTNSPAAQLVRVHLRSLTRGGLSCRAIAAMAHVTPDLVRHLVAGTACTLTADEAQRLLTTRMDLDRIPSRCLVPALATARRVQALAAMGWTRHELCRRAQAVDLDLTAGHLDAVLTSQRCTAATARAIRTLYRNLSMQPGPSTQARDMARQRGWLPPLEWDEESIEDPAGPYPVTFDDDEDEELDHAIAWRLRSGRRVAGLTDRDLDQAILLLHQDLHLSVATVSEHLCIDRRTVQRHLAGLRAAATPADTDLIEVAS